MTESDSEDQAAAKLGGKAIAAMVGGSVGGVPGALVAVALEPVFIHLAAKSWEELGDVRRRSAGYLVQSASEEFGGEPEDVVRYSLDSRLLRRRLDEIAIVPPPGRSSGRLLVLLHGRHDHGGGFLGFGGSSGPDTLLRASLLRALHGLGRRQPTVVLLNGGGFDAPDWSVRVSFANLDDDVYENIGRAVRAVARSYVLAYSASRGVPPPPPVTRAGAAFRS